jgi:AraC-like DNA-binding protein
MSGTANDFAIMHFSTAALPERERVPMLRDFIGPFVARLDIEPVGGEPLHFEVVAHALPELTVSTLAFSAIRAQRTRALAADGNENYLLSWLHSPGNSLTYRGNELTPAEGEGTLISMADPFSCATVSGIARGMSIGVPRKALSAMVPGLDDGLGRAPIRDSETLRLLKRYVGLLDQNEPVSPELRRIVVTHVHDLVALALGASRDAAAIANGRGLRAARLHAFKADIRASLGQQELSLTAIAARHGVSPRYVQAVFESDGTTFSHFLAGERLARVHRILCDPLQMTRSITAIAYAAGFNDLSHFNRAFRRRYGATPSDVRMAARRERSE